MIILIIFFENMHRKWGSRFRRDRGRIGQNGPGTVNWDSVGSKWGPNKAYIGSRGAQKGSYI